MNVLTSPPSILNLPVRRPSLRSFTLPFTGLPPEFEKPTAAR